MLDGIPPRRRAALAALLLAALAARPAHAVVRQPDGTMVPLTTRLRDAFTARGEALDPVRDAAVTPERFGPGCTLRVTVVARGSTMANTFGWYNYVAGRAPAAADLHPLTASGAPAGTSSSLELATDPSFGGGEIGFYLRNAAGQVFYTERAYQPDRASTNGFVHMLVYDSRATRAAFYFAWEDALGGGDSDFDDLVVLVENLVCSGGGVRCDSGERGVCADGLRQCRAGVLSCIRTTGPTIERCDGLDNDCNGMVDDSAGALCAVGAVCERGACVPSCVEGACSEGETCSPAGTCVETGCATVTCPAGQRCAAGRCVLACDGVACPRGRTCRAGRCVDPCAEVMCDGEQYCVDGSCQPRCPCQRCAGALACRIDGVCVEPSCVQVACGPGTYCAGGACRDACMGAVCPRGQACRVGECIDQPRADAGLPDVGTGGFFDATYDARRDGGTVIDPPGCACRAVGPRRARGDALAAIAAGALGALARARRGRRTRGTAATGRGTSRGR